MGTWAVFRYYKPPPNRTAKATPFWQKRRNCRNFHHPVPLRTVVSLFVLCLPRVELTSENRNEDGLLSPYKKRQHLSWGVCGNLRLLCHEKKKPFQENLACLLEWCRTSSQKAEGKGRNDPLSKGRLAAPARSQKKPLNVQHLAASDTQSLLNIPRRWVQFYKQAGGETGQLGSSHVSSPPQLPPLKQPPPPHLSLRCPFGPCPAETWHRSSTGVGNLVTFLLSSQQMLVSWGRGGAVGSAVGTADVRPMAVESPVTPLGERQLLHGAFCSPPAHAHSLGGLIENLLSGTALARCLCTRRNRPRYAERCRCRTPTAPCTPAG